MKKVTLFLFVFIQIINLKAQNTIIFSLKLNSSFFKKGNIKVAIRGNARPLSWEKNTYLKKKGEYFETTVQFAGDINFLEYKYVLEDEKGKMVWELDGNENRFLSIKKGDNKTQDIWDIPSIINVDDLPKISPEQLQADIKILKAALLQLHPGTFRYNNSKSFEANFKKLQQSFSQAQTYKEVYKEVSKFVATIRCGHTYANFFNQNKLIKDMLLNQQDKLPFGLTWIDKKMIIVKNATNKSKIIAGTEILEINDYTSKQILDSLMLVVKADGDNDANRLNVLRLEGHDYYEAFDVYFPLFFLPKNGFYHLKIKYPDNSREEVKVKALNREERYKILSQKYKMPKTAEDTWEFQILEKKIGYLKLGTFAVWNFKMDWKAFLKNSFKQLEKENIKHLIVDIRNNGGGLDEVMDVLRNYLWKFDCELKWFEEKIKFNKIPESLRPYISLWDKSLLDMSDRLKKLDNNFFTWKDSAESLMQTIKKGNNVFEGKTYFLINEANSSATFLLSKKIKACKMATLIGQTTGASQKGINGGNILFLKLPNSKIEVDIPIYGLFDENAEDGGIRPDIEVNKSIKEIIQQKDETLEKALEVIENDK